MEMEHPIDCSELEEMVSSRKFHSEEIDRLLGWEMLVRFFTEKTQHPMQPKEFCDRIGVNPRFTNRINDSVRRKAKLRKY
jgi:hypothetical protein